MSSPVPSPNPFVQGFLRRAGETPQERSQREQEEARAKAVSDAIDEQIERDRVAFERYKKAIKVLLLGQSESGKSMMIKNFQLRYAYSTWVRERSSWKTVIRLNLIRSVTAILEVMSQAMKEQDDRPKHQQRSFSLSQSPPTRVALLLTDHREPSNDERRDLAYDFSDKHRLLRLRLQPLTCVQGDFEKYLGSVLEADRIGTTVHTALPSPDAEWPRSPPRHTDPRGSAADSQKTRSSEEPIQDLYHATQTLYCCESDIKLLWEDDVVQRLLNGARPPLEYSVFSVDDIDRILARDYEPSDQDVVKARVRTVGLREYHFSIPRDAEHEDWIFYDVDGSRASRKAWYSYFDNINSIIFIAPVNCFDQFLAEDASVNRLEDSMLIWKNLCNSKLLANVQLILFLSKIDLLEEKLNSGVRFDKYVVNYGNRPNDVPSVISYLIQQFKETFRNSESERNFHYYLTSAADTKAVSTVVSTVHDAIIRNALTHATFM